MKQRMDIGVFGNSQIECIKNELVIVIPTYSEGDDAFVFKVEYSAQIQLAIVSVLKFRNIGQPLLVKLFSCKITVQDIIGRDFWCGALVLRAFPTDVCF
jgi:hypothetical protein